MRKRMNIPTEKFVILYFMLDTRDVKFSTCNSILCINIYIIRKLIERNMFYIFSGIIIFPCIIFPHIISIEFFDVFQTQPNLILNRKKIWFFDWPNNHFRKNNFPRYKRYIWILLFIRIIVYLSCNIFAWNGDWKGMWNTICH